MERMQRSERIRKETIDHEMDGLDQEIQDQIRSETSKDDEIRRTNQLEEDEMFQFREVRNLQIRRELPIRTQQMTT